MLAKSPSPRAGSRRLVTLLAVALAFVSASTATTAQQVVGRDLESALAVQPELSTFRGLLKVGLSVSYPCGGTLQLTECSPEISRRLLKLPKGGCHGKSSRA